MITSGENGAFALDCPPFSGAAHAWASGLITGALAREFEVTPAKDGHNYLPACKVRIGTRDFVVRIEELQ